MFKITEDKNITVEVGAFGKYVRMQNSSGWQVVSEKAWKVVFAQRQQISSALLDGNADYELRLSVSKVISICEFNDAYYVSFKNIRKSGDKSFENHINYSASEWECVVGFMKDIMPELRKDTIIKVGAAPWQFARKGIKKTSGSTQFALAQRGDNFDVILLLYCHMIYNSILALMKEKCCGCAAASDGQVSHMNGGCQTELDEALATYFDQAKANVAGVLDCNLKKLHIHLKWNLEMIHFDDDEVVRARLLRVWTPSNIEERLRDDKNVVTLLLRLFCSLKM